MHTESNSVCTRQLHAAAGLQQSISSADLKRWVRSVVQKNFRRDLVDDSNVSVLSVALINQTPRFMAATLVIQGLIRAMVLDRTRPSNRFQWVV